MGYKKYLPFQNSYGPAPTGIRTSYGPAPTGIRTSYGPEPTGITITRALIINELDKS